MWMGTRGRLDRRADAQIGDSDDTERRLQLRGRLYCGRPG